MGMLKIPLLADCQSPRTWGCDLLGLFIICEVLLSSFVYIAIHVLYIAFFELSQSFPPTKYGVIGMRYPCDMCMLLRREIIYFLSVEATN
jgi:hypothetical protein